MPKDDTSGYLEANTDDLSLYFSGTFLKVRQKADQEFLYASVGHFHPARTAGARAIELKLAGKRTADLFRMSAMEFDFSFPKLGVYNFKDSVVIFRRRTNRQNKKGLCNGTCFVQPVHEAMREFGPVPELFRMKSGWAWSTANLNSTFLDPKYNTLRDAFRAVSSYKVFARAVSPNFYLAPGIAGEMPTLWHRNTFVGTVADEGTINVENTMLQQEVIDTFRKDGVRINA